MPDPLWKIIFERKERGLGIRARDWIEKPGSAWVKSEISASYLSHILTINPLQISATKQDQNESYLRLTQ
jgi:hypothetical protein